MDNFILISGCSGSGKSTLLAELGARGYRTVAEPGRRIVEAEQASGGTALPWVDMTTFLHRTLDLAIADHEHARAADGLVFFDRGVVDALVALRHITGALPDGLAAQYRYAARVFLTPPWPEIYETDPARQHGLEDAVAEYVRLQAAFPALGYCPHVLPKVPVTARAAGLLSSLSGAGA